MKILIVANGFPPTAYGGVEVYCYDLARELQKRGYTVKVFCREAAPEKPDGEWWEDTIDGIPVVRIANNMREQYITFRYGYVDERVERVFEQVLDDFRPELVHINHTIALSARLPHVTRQRGIPTVMTLHDYWTICPRVNLLTHGQKLCPGQKTPAECYRCAFLPQFNYDVRKRIALRFRPLVKKGLELLAPGRLERGPLLKLILNVTPADYAERQNVFREALEQVEQIVVPSEFIQSVIVANGYHKKPVQVIPLGIGFPALPEREAAPRDTLRFGFVGSILPTKGLHVLIRAFRKVAAENIRLDVYGREDLNVEYTRQLRFLARSDRRIVFHGAFSPEQRAEIFGQMDVFVMPSIWHETFSFVAREALQARVPVIASRVGALQDAVVDGVNGFLFPPGDERALSKIIKNIAGSPERLKSLAVPGPLEILQVPEHVDRLEQVYRRVL